jgi:hypothetical protein
MAALQAASALSPQRNFPPAKPAPRAQPQTSTKIYKTSQSSSVFDCVNGSSGNEYIYTLARTFQTEIHSHFGVSTGRGILLLALNFRTYRDAAVDKSIQARRFHIKFQISNFKFEISDA